jgi:hypothetical protein
MSIPCEGLLYMIMIVCTCIEHDYRDIDAHDLSDILVILGMRSMLSDMIY